MKEGTCTHPGCGRTGIKARGYCNLHYVRWARGKDMDAPAAPRGLSRAERFWSKVRKEESCWVWTGATNSGYGVFNMGGYTRQAHRISYEWRFGDIPPGLEVDHVCHNRACVNPAHFRLADKSQNGQNRSGLSRNNQSGYRGVYWNPARRKWMGKAEVRGVHFCDAYESKEEAAEAVSKWRAEHMPFSIKDRQMEVA